MYLFLCCRITPLDHEGGEKNYVYFVETTMVCLDLHLGNASMWEKWGVWQDLHGSECSKGSFVFLPKWSPLRWFWCFHVPLLSWPLIKLFRFPECAVLDRVELPTVKAMLFQMSYDVAMHRWFRIGISQWVTWGRSSNPTIGVVLPCHWGRHREKKNCVILCMKLTHCILGSRWFLRFKRIRRWGGNQFIYRPCLLRLLSER